MSDRIEALRRWLQDGAGLGEFRLHPASGDASFRRYFRVVHPDGTSLVAMDAPPDQESCHAFVRIAGQFEALGLHVPHIFASDLELGFMLLEDLGSRHYLDVLTPDNADALYGDAFNALMRIQSKGPRQGLPLYDGPFLRREMTIFTEWLLQGALGLELQEEELGLLDRVFGVLVQSALEQPTVCVHRDFHSRNLLVSSPSSPGIIDFQDAVIGPVTYDLVSLLRDCYIRWPAEQVRGWARQYYSLALRSGVLAEVSEERFMRWFDLMGIQRHLKASGIFCRLKLRDGKSGYLGDIPRTLDYIVEVAQQYPELLELGSFVSDRVIPRFPLPTD
jgi:aminoglycoside/choline kinase family phosphotransferase